MFSNRLFELQIRSWFSVISPEIKDAPHFLFSEIHEKITP